MLVASVLLAVNTAILAQQTYPTKPKSALQDPNAKITGRQNAWIWSSGLVTWMGNRAWKDSALLSAGGPPADVGAFGKTISVLGPFR